MKNGTKIAWACGHRPAGSKKTVCWYQRVDRRLPEPTPNLSRTVEMLTVMESAR